MKNINLYLRKFSHYTPYLTVGFYTLSSIALLYLPFMILLNLNRGLDLSDTGFYYNSIISYENANIITQFGSVYALILSGENIVLSRLFVFLCVTLSGAFFIRAIFSTYSSWHMLEISIRRILYAAGASSAALFYTLWVPDPSYNTASFSLNLFIATSALFISINLKKDARFDVWAICAGAAITALFLTRASTALITGVTMAIYVLAIGRPNVESLIRLVALSLFGSFVYATVSSLAVEPIWISTARMFEAASNAQEISSIAPQTERFLNFIGFLININQIQIFGVILLVIAQNLMGINPPGRMFSDTIWKATFFSLGIAALIMILYPALSVVYENAGASLSLLAESISALIQYSILSIFVKICFTLRRETSFTIIVTSLMVLVLWVSQIYGTGNSWLPFGALYSIFPATLIIIAFIVNKEKLHTSGVFLLLMVLTTLQFVAWQAASQHPYRLPSGLNDQIHPATIRGNYESIFVDEQSLTLINQLNSANASVGEERPILINLSGATPMIAYILDFRTTGVPWLLGGYTWSAEFFDRQLSRLSARELCHAWVLIAPNSPQALSQEQLHDYDINLQIGYEIAASGMLPYPGVNYELYRPIRPEERCAMHGD